MAVIYLQKKLNREQIRDYLLSLKASDYGFFFQESYRQRTLMSSAFAIMTLELIGELGILDSEKEANYFQKVQDKSSGLFLDPIADQPPRDLQNIDHNYIHYQTTAFAISSLHSMGFTAKHKFNFLNPFRENQYIVNWLAELDWKNPWHVSNMIMFILQFFSYEDIVLGNEHSRESLLFILEELRKYQDPISGLWGTDRGASDFNGMAGTFHFLSFFQYYGVKLHFTTSMHTSTLNLQARDGLFHPFGGGGACEDLDALYILNTVEYESIEASSFKQKMLKSYKAILATQNSDGGFCWAKRPKWSLSVSTPFLNPFSSAFHIDTAKWIIKRRLLSKVIPALNDPIVYHYSSWSAMRYNVTESDTWSTWFRLLSLAAIERSFPELRSHNIEFHTRALPALGWQRN